MNDEYSRLIGKCKNELAVLTCANHAIWRFGEEQSWQFDQDQGAITFLYADGTLVRSSAQVVGTFDHITDTWLWAWANPTLTSAITVDALTVKAYGERLRIEQLTAPSWPGSESDGWSITSLAVNLCNAQGAYRGLVGRTAVFFTFGEVSIENSPRL